MMQIIDIKTLSQLDPTTLLQPDVYTAVENFVYDVEADGEPEQARVVFVTLSKLLSETNNQQAVNKYISIILALRLISLSLTKDSEKEKFLSDNIAELARQPYAGLEKWLKQVIVFYGFDEAISPEFQRLCIRAFDKSLNLLGTSEISVGGKSVKPFVKYWLQDFNSQPSQKMERGTLEETTYINQSPNVRKLSAQDRDTLRKLLHAYNWMKYRMLRFEVPAADQQQPARPPVPASVSPVPAPKTAPRPVAPPAPAPQKPATAFEQKLAEAGKPSSAHGQSLEALKHNLEEKGVVKLVEPGTTVKMTPQEIKRELNTPELAKPASQPDSDVMSDLRKVIQPPQPQAAARPIPPASAPSKVLPINHHPSTSTPISVLDDLKKLDVGYLRAAPLVSQIMNIRSQIINLARANKVLPYYTVNAFEQSPLFKSYLAHGSSKFGGGGDSGALTQQEFEAIADLRKELDRL